MQNSRWDKIARRTKGELSSAEIFTHVFTRAFQRYRNYARAPRWSSMNELTRIAATRFVQSLIYEFYKTHVLCT